MKDVTKCENHYKDEEGNSCCCEVMGFGAYCCPEEYRCNFYVDYLEKQIEQLKKENVKLQERIKWLVRC